MELEFDKEIDAILRKAKRGSVATADAPLGGHLDADELAAFAENALPDRSRQAYIAHLADCDMCRKTLSGFISMNREAAPEAAFDAVAPAVKIPWYRSLFAIPNLAYVMGTLVVVFSGVIGYLVLQNRNADSNAQISKVTEKPAVQSAPAVEDRIQESNAASTNSAANTATSSPIESVTKSGVAVGSSANTTVAQEEQPAGKDEVASNEPTAGKPVKEPEAPATAAQPPPAKGAPSVMTERDEKSENKKLDKTKDDSLASADASKQKAAEDQRALREIAPSPRTGPSRAAGPKQQMNTQNNTVTQGQTSDLPINGRSIDGLVVVTSRSVGGKTFNLRDGVWYDSAYSGGGTKTVKRGTDKFLRLDEGLRNIANAIGGTVVVVWSGKAYKIQ